MKTIIIIGGNKGVGLEIVKKCISKGFNVATCFKETVKNFPLEQNSKIIAESLDLQDINECKSFIKKVIIKWNKIDGIVFYAGVTPLSSLTECSEKVYDEIFNINLKSTFFITQTVLKNMIENGGGSIVFFGTSQMESGEMDRAAYAISKGGIKILSEHLARRYAHNQIRSNIIVMGWTPTDGEIKLRSSMGISKEQLIKEANKHIPMGRMLTVKDPVPAVIHLLSDESSMTTGSILRINGGEYI
tara:strand:+ start:659 stop:1393 length:735 start_codon:yes stop_codon:yes gene_type:complete